MCVLLTGRGLKAVQSEASRAIAIGFEILYPTHVNQAVFLCSSLDMLCAEVAKSITSMPVGCDGAHALRVAGVDNIELMLACAQFPRLMDSRFWLALVEGLDGVGDISPQIDVCKTSFSFLIRSVMNQVRYFSLFVFFGHPLSFLRLSFFQFLGKQHICSFRFFHNWH